MEGEKNKALLGAAKKKTKTQSVAFGTDMDESRSNQICLHIFAELQGMKMARG